MAPRAFQIPVRGLTPLLCSNISATDPLCRETKIRKSFTGKNKRMDEDHLALRKLDWLTSGYWAQTGDLAIDEENNDVVFRDYAVPYMPAANITRCIRNAATRIKKGADCDRALVVRENPPITYKGPTDANEMFASGDFAMTCAALRGIGKTRQAVWVTRLTFKEWSFQLDILIDDEVISPEQLSQIVGYAGRFEGLGTWRARYGRFVAGDVVEVEL